ncbi:MAG TPA: hypothetical protein VIU61_21815 [Kofleriaceae bacterium]
MEPESRDRLIREAKRKELVDGARRARVNIPIGITVSLVGAGIAYFAIRGGFFGPAFSIFVAGLGLVLVPVGIAIMARAITTIGIAHRQVRELDALALPAARVVRRD